MEIKRPKNFFGENIPLTVFISEEQLHNKECVKVYGKYFEDTGIFNIFPAELSDKGEYLGDILHLQQVLRHGSAPIHGFYHFVDYILPHVGWCRCTHILFNSLHTLH